MSGPGVPRGGTRIVQDPRRPLAQLPPRGLAAERLQHHPTSARSSPFRTLLHLFTPPPGGPRQIINPWGEVVARLPDPSATGIAVADVDLGALRRVREKMPIREHRLRGRAQYLGE